jgi:integrase
MVRRPSLQRRLPLAEWPQADQRAWNAAASPAGLLDDSGAAAHLSEVTIGDLESRYAYVLDFARRTERLDVDGPAAVTVTPTLIDDYVAWLDTALSSETIAQSLRKIGRVCSLIAPERDWQWLRRVQRRREAIAVPRDKRHRIVDSGTIIQAGFDLMERAESHRSLTKSERAVVHRDGLMLAFLAALPLRMRNFVGLEIGRTLIRSGGTWTVSLPAAEAKNRGATEHHVLPAIGERIDRFIADYRIAFSGSNEHARLWPSRRGGPLSYSAVYQVITRRTEAAFGRSINPHLFRDCATTTVAVNHGDRIGIVPALLGHRDPRTFERYYNQAGLIEAVNVYQDLIAELTNG